MKHLKSLALLMGMLCAAVTAKAQNTTITATIPSYANGSVVATFVAQGGGKPSGSGHISSTIGATGYFSLPAWDNTYGSYAPSSVTLITICGPSPYAGTCYSQTLQISGTTEDVSSYFSSAPTPGNTVTPGGSNGDYQVNNNGKLGGVTIIPVAHGGTGTATPGLQAGANIASISGTWPNQVINAAAQTSTPQYTAPQPVSGCGVEYVSGLTYTVGACTYSINGTTYTAPLTNITLPAADPTNPEIDVIYVDTTSTVHYLQGTAAATPQAPTVDPSTQLELTFVLVPATATTPSNTTTSSIYLENAEWTGATGGTNAANVNLASTNFPYAGTKDVEFGSGGTVASTTYAQFTKPASGTETLTNYNNLIFYIRNKAAWANGRSVTIQWYNGSTAVGNAVVFTNGSYGFSSSNTSSYQQISIPTSVFATSGNPVTTLRFTVSGSGSALTGFYLDQITLQGGTTGVVLPSTLMNYKGAYSSTATYQPNDVVTQSNNTYVALTANTNTAVSTTSTWVQISGSGTNSAYGTALATGGETIITLGSTPTANSLRMFNNGVLLPPSYYTISGATVTMGSSYVFNANDLLSVTWTTTASNVGGVVAFSQNNGIRASTVATNTVTSSELIVQFPAATQVGDRMIIILNTTASNTPAAPSGWSVNNSTCGSNSFITGTSYTKVMTSADVAAGSVDFGMNTNWGAAAVDLVGNVTIAGTTAACKANPASLSLSGAAVGYNAIYYGSTAWSAGAGPAGAITVNRGTVRGTSSNNTNAAMALYSERISTAGTIAASVSYVSPYFPSFQDPETYSTEILLNTSTPTPTPFPLINPGQLAAPAYRVGSSETVTFSATPTFSTSWHNSYIVLTGNVTSFTLGAGVDGQEKVLTFCQDATGSRTVTAPANVHGFFSGNAGAIGSTASKCSVQHYVYSAGQSAWLASSGGVVNQ